MFILSSLYGVYEESSSFKRAIIKLKNATICSHFILLEKKQTFAYSNHFNVGSIRVT